LRYRSFDLYGWYPEQEKQPHKPRAYCDLIWADPMPAKGNVCETLETQVRNRDNRTTRIIAQAGWLFGKTKD